MRTMMMVCLAVGVAGAGLVSPARAEDPYWRTHHDVEWRNRTEFREAEHRKPEWLREHCVRDWAGKELCRP